MKPINVNGPSEDLTKLAWANKSSMYPSNPSGPSASPEPEAAASPNAKLERKIAMQQRWQKEDSKELTVCISLILFNQTQARPAGNVGKPICCWMLFVRMRGSIHQKLIQKVLLTMGQQQNFAVLAMHCVSDLLRDALGAAGMCSTEKWRSETSLLHGRPQVGTLLSGSKWVRLLFRPYKSKVWGCSI